MLYEQIFQHGSRNIPIMYNILKNVTFTINQQ